MLKLFALSGVSQRVLAAEEVKLNIGKTFVYTL